MTELNGKQAVHTEAKVLSLGLKYKNEAELLALIINSGPGSCGREKEELHNAYQLARVVHADDSHREAPYIYHCLRVASRITGYLRVYEKDILIAALLHDSVEDHPETVVSELKEYKSLDVETTETHSRLQQQALGRIAGRFSPYAAQTVAMVTNPPALSDPQLKYEQRLDGYVRKVKRATSTPEGWMVKFSDWCDNAVGVNHGEQYISTDRSRHFRTKYGRVLKTFETRLQDDDIRELLDMDARTYAYQQLRLGSRRLITG